MNAYKSMNRLFLVTLLVYLIGVNVTYYFLWKYLESEYTLTAVCEFFAILAPCIYCMKKGYDAGEDLGFRYFKSEAIVPVIGCALLLVPLVAFISLISQLFVTNATDSLTEGLAQGSFAMNFLFIAIVPAVVEETIFRGVFYQQLRKHGVLVAMFFSAAMFGFFHLNFNQFFYAVIAGMFFTFLVEATGSVWASILAHITINGFNVIEYEFYLRQQSMVSEEELASMVAESQNSVWLYVGYGLAAIICTYLSIRLLKRICNICDRRFTWEQLIHTEKVKRFTVPLFLSLAIALAYMIRIELVL